MNWTNCKNLLIIRPDNMGDLLMSSPAIRALKQAFDCKITVLTTPLASEAAVLVPEIDDTINVSLPWVKAGNTISPSDLLKLTDYIRLRKFDGCIIFTVYSQNPMPSAMLAWMAGIPRCLAYCRENPYELINYWVPDPEPYSHINHQVERDLELVKQIGVTTLNTSIELKIPANSVISAENKLKNFIAVNSDFIVIHAGVSELKRAYPLKKWIELSKAIVEQFDIPILFTGAGSEKQLSEKLQKETGNKSFSVAGMFNISELASVIDKSRLLISVNTGPVHIAAGLRKPVIVFYATTNPQHKPWKTPGAVFEFSVNSELTSRNEVIKHVNNSLYKKHLPYPDVSQIIASVQSLLYKNEVE